MFLVSHSHSFSILTIAVTCWEHTMGCTFTFTQGLSFGLTDREGRQAVRCSKCLWKDHLTNDEIGTGGYIPQLPLSSIRISSVQFSSVTQSCPTLCNPMNHSTPGLPIYHQLPKFTQTHVHQVSDAIQASHPLLYPSPPAPNPSQHQSLFQWVNSSHEVAKVLEFQL